MSTDGQHRYLNDGIPGQVGAGSTFFLGQAKSMLTCVLLPREHRLVKWKGPYPT